MAGRRVASASLRKRPTEVRKILIVDNSEIIRSRLQSLVADLDGATVVGMATDARQALLLFQSVNPDLVILDLRMPEGSGLDVLQEIKARSPSTQVAILTNYPYAAYRKRCAELGADYFFDKATEFEMFKTIL